MTPEIEPMQVGARNLREAEKVFTKKISQALRNRVSSDISQMATRKTEQIIEQTGVRVAGLILEEFQTHRNRTLKELLQFATSRRVNIHKLLKKNLVVMANEVANLRLVADSLLSKRLSSKQSFQFYRWFLQEYRLLLHEMREVMLLLDKAQQAKKEKPDKTLEEILGGGEKAA